MGFFSNFNHYKKSMALMPILLAGGFPYNAHAQFDCAFNVQNEWGNAAIANLSVLNNTSSALNTENITVTFPEGISVTNVWNGTVTGNNPYTFSGPAWSPQLTSGAQIGIGLQLSIADGAELNPEVGGSCGSSGVEANSAPVITDLSCTEGYLAGDGIILGEIYSTTYFAYCTVEASDADGDPLTYTLDWGDNTSTGPQPSNRFYQKTYVNSAEYTITATANDGKTQTNAASTYRATGNGVAPTIAFDCEVSNGDLTLNCDASASVSGNDEPILFWWILTEQSSLVQRGETAEFQVSTLGSYTVQLWANDSDHHHITFKNKTFELVGEQLNTAPHASFVYSGIDYCSSTSTVTFDATSSTDPDGDALSYHWQFSDGTLLDGAVVTKILPTTDLGGIRAELTVVDSSGATDVLSQVITAPQPAPMHFMVHASEQSGTAPLAVDFTLETLGATLNQSPTWYFDDGTKPVQAFSPSHNFTEPGTYNVTVDYEITNMCGATVSGSQSTQVSVTEPSLPQLSCEYAVISDWGQGFTAELRITNNSDDPVESWAAEWNYSNGSSVTNYWNGTLKTTGNDHTVTSAGWNSSIAPGQTSVVGIQGISAENAAEIPELNCSL